jgi:hypothetical protein
MSVITARLALTLARSAVLHLGQRRTFRALELQFLTTRQNPVVAIFASLV